MDLGRIRGGLEGKGSGPGGLQEVPRTAKKRFWSYVRFPRNAPDLINILVSAFFEKKTVFFQNGPRKIFRERQGGSREVRFALQRFPRRPSGKWHGSKGALFEGSWIGKSSPGLKF